MCIIIFHHFPMNKMTIKLDITYSVIGFCHLGAPKPRFCEAEHLCVLGDGVQWLLSWNSTFGIYPIFWGSTWFNPNHASPPTMPEEASDMLSNSIPWWRSIPNPQSRGVLRGDFHLWLRVLRDLGHHEIFTLHLRKSCHGFWDIPLAKPISKKDIWNFKRSIKSPQAAGVFLSQTKNPVVLGGNPNKVDSTSLLRGQRQIVPWGDLFVVCQEEETVVVRTLLSLGKIRLQLVEMLTNSRDVDLQKVVDFDQESGCQLTH